MVNRNNRKQRNVRVIEQQLNQSKTLLVIKKKTKKLSCALGPLECRAETTFVSLRHLSAAHSSFSCKKCISTMANKRLRSRFDKRKLTFY